MPLGVSKDAAHFRELLEKGVMLKKDRVEGSVDLGDRAPVYAGIIVDVEGYGPHIGALYVTQGYGNYADESLQEAHQILEEWKFEHYRDHYEELEKEYGDDAMSVFTETFDGWAFKLSPHEFADAVRGTDAEKFIDIEPEEEGDPDEVDEGDEDPSFIIQGIYDDGTLVSGYEYGYDDEATAIREAQRLARSYEFEGDYVRVITRDGDLVWDSRRSRKR